jgi:hypothetical protein
MLDSAERARRVIHEINAREAYDQWAEEHERAADLGRWHTADLQDGDQRDAVDGDQVDDVDDLADDYGSTP